MNRPTMFFRTLAKVSGVAAALALVSLPLYLAANDEGHLIFSKFQQIDGVEQAQPIDDDLGDFSLNSRNKFFDPGLGTNGQACVTCHQPADGYDIHVSSIQNAFAATNDAAGSNPLAVDPLFRVNDTADNPFADVSTPLARTNAFKLFLNMGVIRFARPAAGISGQDFAIAPQTTAQFGDQPHTGDPEAASPTANVISVFRRPLINLNVRFDSSVLWDGRESITDLRTQVTKAAKSLLGAHTVSPTDADEVAAFMLGVEIDTVSNTSFHAGNTFAGGATGGVQNLVELASSPKQPCRFDAIGNPTLSVTPPLGLLTGSKCTTVIPGGPNMTVFDAWATPPNNANSAGRLAVARGQAIFNTANLTVPPDLVGQLGSVPIHCTTCHAVNNLGNHPDANFFVRIGTDSVQILQDLAINHPSTSDPQRLQNMADRVSSLPQYCLRPTSDPTSCVITTDPGRALVTGHIADVGKFKPPVLRNFISRAPYFHAGAAIEDDNLVDFYNARFQIGLTAQEHDDLIAFLNSF